MFTSTPCFLSHSLGLTQSNAETQTGEYQKWRVSKANRSIRNFLSQSRTLVLYSESITNGNCKENMTFFQMTSSEWYSDITIYYRFTHKTTHTLTQYKIFFSNMWPVLLLKIIWSSMYTYTVLLWNAKKLKSSPPIFSFLWKRSNSGGV